MASTPAPLTTRPATPLPPRSTADRPPPDLRTEAFVRSQIPYLDYYQRQGEALWSAYLDTLEDERDKDERNAAVRPSRKPSLVHPTGLEGLQGVDLLNELAAKGTSVASGSKEILSGGLGRVRLIDRMKGKDGEERKRVGATTKKTAKEPKKEPKEPRISKPTPQEPLINSTELDHSESGGSEVVLTRKELQRRLGPQTQSTRLPTITPAHGASLSPIEPLAPAGSRSAKKRASSEVIASSDQVSSPDKRRRTRRTDPELQTSSTHHIRPSSPLRKTPHRTTRTPRSVSVLHLSELSATVECANDPKTKEKAKITPTDPTGKRPKVKTKPAISTEEEVVVQKRGFQGLNETDGCDADHVVRLADRKRRRREKAAIIQAPKVDPTGSPALIPTHASGPRKHLSAEKNNPKDGVDRVERVKRKHTKKDKEQRANKKEARNQRKGDTARNLGRAAGLMGLGAMDTFKASNVGGSRLTLQPLPRLGVFNKGKASLKVIGTGTSVKRGLVFSETRFLNQHLSPLDVTNVSSTTSPSSNSFRRKTRRCIQPEPRDSTKKAIKNNPDSDASSKCGATTEPSLNQDQSEANSEDEKESQPQERVTSTITKSPFFASVASPGRDNRIVRRQPAYSPSWPEMEEEEAERPVVKEDVEKSDSIKSRLPQLACAKSRHSTTAESSPALPSKTPTLHQPSHLTLSHRTCLDQTPPHIDSKSVVSSRASSPRDPPVSLDSLEAYLNEADLEKGLLRKRRIYKGDTPHLESSRASIPSSGDYETRNLWHVGEPGQLPYSTLLTHTLIRPRSQGRPAFSTRSDSRLPFSVPASNRLPLLTDDVTCFSACSILDSHASHDTHRYAPSLHLDQPDDESFLSVSSQYADSMLVEERESGELSELSFSYFPRRSSSCHYQQSEDADDVASADAADNASLMSSFSPDYLPASHEFYDRLDLANLSCPQYRHTSPSRSPQLTPNASADLLSLPTSRPQTGLRSLASRPHHSLADLRSLHSPRRFSESLPLLHRCMSTFAGDNIYANQEERARDVVDGRLNFQRHRQSNLADGSLVSSILAAQGRELIEDDGYDSRLMGLFKRS